MKISDLSPEQTAVLQRSLEDSNRGSKELPAPEDYAASLLADTISALALGQQRQDDNAAMDQFRALLPEARAVIAQQINAAKTPSLQDSIPPN